MTTALLQLGNMAVRACRLLLGVDRPSRPVQGPLVEGFPLGAVPGPLVRVYRPS